MFLQCEGFEPLPLAPSVRSIATEVSYSVSRSFYLNEWFEHAGAEVSETAERAICILDGLPLSAVSKNTGSLFGVPIRRILVSWGYISGSLFVEMPISHRAAEHLIPRPGIEFSALSRTGQRFSCSWFLPCQNCEAVPTQCFGLGH